MSKNELSGVERGAILVEFALVAPLLVAITVGIIYYGYAFVIKAATEHAAKNAVQEAVAINPLSDGYSEGLLLGRARKVAIDSLDWLPASAVEVIRVEMAEECDGSGEFGIHVRLPLTTDGGGVLPQFSLGRFSIPPLPTTIDSMACASV